MISTTKISGAKPPSASTVQPSRTASLVMSFAAITSSRETVIFKITRHAGKSSAMFPVTSLTTFADNVIAT